MTVAVERTYEDIVREWHRARNQATDCDVGLVDAAYAAQAGLPVLAALHRLYHRLEDGNRWVSTAEVLSELRPVLGIAIGEAQRRAQYIGSPAEAPGVPILTPGPILEQLPW